MGIGFCDMVVDMLYTRGEEVPSKFTAEEVYNIATVLKGIFRVEEDKPLDRQGMCDLVCDKMAELGYLGGVSQMRCSKIGGRDCIRIKYVNGKSDYVESDFKSVPNILIDVVVGVKKSGRRI